MNKPKEWCQKWMKRENMIVLALSGILIMVIALPVGDGKKGKSTDSESVLLDSEAGMIKTENAAGTEEQEAVLEQRLEGFLSCMEGVGEVRVLLTFAATEETVVEKDIPASSRSDTREKDSAGGSRSISEQDSTQETVYTTDAAGNRIPYVKKKLSPRVEGVTVLAQGGESALVRQKITQMMEALFDIEAHKIIVAKMAGTGDG